MSSAYGKLPDKEIIVPSFLPLQETLDDGLKVQICELALQPQQLLDEVHLLLNHVIEEGKTYPHEHVLDLDGFQAYFQTGFVLKDFNNKVYGAFYVKPNFPGRCSHICNGGFIVKPECRGLGVGKALGRSYLKIAPAMGYKASIFNLVFENNTV